MRLLNTRFNIDKALNRKELLRLASNWLNTSQYYNLDISGYDDSEEWQVENSENTQRAFIGNYDDIFVMQFIVNSDNDSSVYTTTYVLDDVSDIPSIHLSQDKTFTGIATNTNPAKANLPNILKDIFWHEYGGDDNGILTEDKPYVLRKSDLALAESVILDKVKFQNPIVYISPASHTGYYPVNCEMIAQSLMGQAHVIVEGSPVIASAVRDVVDGKNPFNGAVCIYASGSAPVKLVAKENCNFNLDVINAVRSMLAHTTVDDKFDFDKIRRTKLLARCEDGEISKICDEMLNEKDAVIAQLRKELAEVKSDLMNSKAKADNLQNQFDKADSTDNTTDLIVTEKELYDGEINTVVLKVLQKEYDMMKDDSNLSRSRKADILKDILDHNFPCTTDIELAKCIRSAFEGGALSRDGIGCLQSSGFTVDKGKGHYKVFFKDDRYVGTFSSTPSDNRGVKNGVSDFINNLFGY